MLLSLALIPSYTHNVKRERECESCKERTSDVNKNPCVSMPLYIHIF